MIRISPVLILLTGTAFAQDTWTTDLAYGGGGYWSVRVPVTVENGSDAELLGAPVKVIVGEGGLALEGHPAESLRVCDAKGQEMKYGLTSVVGLPKVEGALETGDTLTYPVEAPARESVVSYVYAGNADAWAPPEPFGASFVNGGFESGDGPPAGWRTYLTDATHRMYLQEGGAHSGEACARCEVDAGATAEWVKYVQGPIPVIPGTTYRFTAWAKGEDVVGNAGWYIHVDGNRPQMVNLTGAWEGTFDWREAVIEFEVPEGAQVLSCGTLLHGTGKAWFDDAKLEQVGAAQVRVSVGQPEERKLDRNEPAADLWDAHPDWRWKTPVVVRNFGDETNEAVLLSVNMHRPRTMLAKHTGWRYDLPVRVIDPEKPGEPLRCAWAGGKLLTVTRVQARTEKVLSVYWSAKAKAEGASEVVGLEDWAASELSLAENGSMEDGDGAVATGWPSGEEGGAAEGRFTARRARGGVQGDWCLELAVPDTVENVGWVGSRQSCPVRPSTKYLLAGYIQSEGVSGNPRIHGHFQKADKSLSDFGPFFGTEPPIGGDSDWTFTAAHVTTPPDCAFLEIHLTMNSTGTLRHDAVMLLQAQEGQAGEMEQARVPDSRAGALDVWSVNPLVKVFPDDTWMPWALKMSVYSSRNAREPCQLAIRAERDVEVEVKVGELTGPDDATLAPPTVYEVGYVPIDHPQGYSSSEQPHYHRLKPTSTGTDGWAGDWPDPLIPLTNGKLTVPADRTTALWVDIDVPAETTPGTYWGTVELVVDGRTDADVLIELNVWPYTLPERKSCKAIYDLRSGPRGNIFSSGGGDELEQAEVWYRMLAEYNISPGLITPRPTMTEVDGRMSIDYTDFDRACELLFDELNCNAAYTPWFFYSFGWAHKPKSYFGHEAFTPEWEAIFQDGLRDFFDHVKERGWDENFVYYVSDEPDATDVEIHAKLAEVCDVAREAVPEVLVYSSTWRHLTGLDDHLNLWGVGPHASFPVDEIEERRTHGDRFWFTTDGHMCIDTPYLGIERLLPWFCYKYGVEAYEFWGVSWWTYDPWDRGWHTYIRQSHDGETYRWVRYPNGDGYLAYPGERFGQDEPLPSIRLMAAREGLEDFEVFAELERRAEDSPAAQRALDEVRELVSMPNKGGRYSTDIMPNPDAVMQARVKAGRALAKLME